MYRTIIVFDFETDSPDPKNANPVQLAALAINGLTLKPIRNAEFVSDCKPDGVDNDDYLTEERKKTLAWHSKVQQVDQEKVLERWKNAPNEKMVWSEFHKFVNRFNKKGTSWFAPIQAGMNIRNFDCIIANRLNEKHKKKTCFFKRDVIDILEMAFYWFHDLEGGPSNNTMDTLRKWLKMPDRGKSHDALVDVRDEAVVIITFIQMFRSVCNHPKFTERLREKIQENVYN